MEITFMTLKMVVFASLTFLLCEIISTLGIEVERVWTKPKTSKSLFLKATFLFMRYFPFPIQFINLYFIHRGFAGTGSSGFCKGLFLYETLVLQFFTTALESVLAWRVYATYREDNRIAFVLCLVLAAEFTFTCVLAAHLLSVSMFDNYCHVTNNPKGLAYSGYSMIISQSIVGAIQGWGLWRIYTMTEGGMNALLQLLMRDHAITFFVIIGFVVSAMIFMKYLIYLTFFFIITVVASIGCRLVLNMHALAVAEKPESVEELSTILRADEVEEPQGVHSVDEQYPAVDHEDLPSSIGHNIA